MDWGTVLSPRVQRLCIPGWPSPGTDLSPSSSPSMATPGRLPQSQGTATDQPSIGQTQALTSQVSRLLAKVSEPRLCPTRHLIPKAWGLCVCEMLIPAPDVSALPPCGLTAFQELDHPSPLPSDTMVSSLVATQEKVEDRCLSSNNLSVVTASPVRLGGVLWLSVGRPSLSLPSTRHLPLYDKLPLLPSLPNQSYHLLRFCRQHPSSALSAGLRLTSHLALFQRCLTRL